jgi:PAS domain S-box-containing protein
MTYRRVHAPPIPRDGRPDDDVRTMSATTIEPDAVPSEADATPREPGDGPAECAMTTPAASPLPGSAELPAHLRRAVEESAGLLHAAGAMLYLLDDTGERLRWAYDAGLSAAPELAWVHDLEFPVGVGLFGRAVAEQRVQATDDYATDHQFVHSPRLDRFVDELDVRAMIVAPLVGANGPIGALGAFSHAVGAFADASGGLLSVLATHAALAIDNARLIDELATSRAALATRAGSERSLREIAARITVIRDPSIVARQVVDESRRLLRTDAAMLALLDGDEMHSAVVSGDLDPETMAAVTGDGLHVRGSLLGGAFGARSAVTTADYLADVVAREDGHNVALARQLDIRGIAVAPLRVEDRTVGLLGVWSHVPRRFAIDELELLQGMADVAAIAVDNAHLTSSLATSEQRYRFLIERAPDLVWEVDREERLVFLNDRVESLLGWPAGDLVGRSALDLVHPDAVDAVRREWSDSWSQPGVERTYRFALRHRDGHAVPVELRSVGIRVDGELVGFQGSLRDESERNRLERDLRRQEAEIAASQERAKLAQELHDSVTQALFSMTLTTRSAEMLLDRDPTRVPEKLTELRELASDALAEMRGLIFELRPGSLDRDGLVSAIRKHAAAVQGRSGLAIAVEESGLEVAPPLPVDRPPIRTAEPSPHAAPERALETGFPPADPSAAGRVPPDVEEALYRIAQEALHNVIKHARATSARVAIARDLDGLHLTVTDDGVGFDPDAVPSGHLGLEGMRARAARIDARLAVTSSPGAGTTIEILVPLGVPASAAAAQ